MGCCIKANATDGVVADSIATDATDIVTAPVTMIHDFIAIDTIQPVLTEQPKKKLNFFQKIGKYFKDSNKVKDKAFDVSFIGGPHYASDTKFGIGLIGAGLYRMDRQDKTIQPSSVSLFADISTVGFWLVGIKGTNIFPHDKYRLNYTLYLYSFPTRYWGIGYENGSNSDNLTSIKRFQAKIKAEFLIRLTKNLYIGPTVQWDYVTGSLDNKYYNPENYRESDADTPAQMEERMLADRHKREALFEGQKMTNRNYSFGAVITYDSRDNMNNAYKGFFVEVRQLFKPRFLWNDYYGSTTQFEFDWYKQAWKGSVIAVQLAGQFNFGNPHWGMMANIGSSNTMRGYYEGQYRDKHKLEAQVEIRQHIWRRFGMVAWGGVGSAFHDGESFKHLLPNYGLGLRWEFKHRMNVRLDVGFGKRGTMGFVFNVNEAF